MSNPVQDQSKIKLAKLANPIEKEGKTLTEIEISKPNSGHLRGLNLVDVCEMDFGAGEKILPRISCLNERDLLNLDPANWAPLLVTVASFFVNTEA
ncbi:phage tail assembly protein [Vibrio clamense]|uniref:phage tail assembly protein n=1 Tax=Vibrio clamense TaxID=2910254 RepID=UPI003D1F89ED